MALCSIIHDFQSSIHLFGLLFTFLCSFINVSLLHCSCVFDPLSMSLWCVSFVLLIHASLFHHACLFCQSSISHLLCWSISVCAIVNCTVCFVICIQCTCYGGESADLHMGYGCVLVTGASTTEGLEGRRYRLCLCLLFTQNICPIAWSFQLAAPFTIYSLNPSQIQSTINNLFCQ